MEMSTAKEVRLSMKVVINKEKTKVLFGIVDNNLADILLSFLTLPLGWIIRLLKHHYGDGEAVPIIGSFNTLYEGLENLSISHVMELSKLSLLYPTRPLEEECRKLKISLDYDQPIKYFKCENMLCKSKKSCCCGKTSEVFVVKTKSFIITDDLKMLPNVARSTIQSINDLGIIDANGGKQRTVHIGLKEIMELLKGSLLSQTPLTDLILGKRKKQIMNQHSSSIPQSEPSALLPDKMTKEAASSKRFVVKAVIQRSTNKLVFVEADKNFIDFLFGFLVIPLAKVESLLDSDTSFGSIDNLYKSLENLSSNKFLKSEVTKEKLLEVPSVYLSENQILFLTGMSTKLPTPHPPCSFVWGPGMYMVKDDLTVVPLRILSTLSTLNELNIAFSDVEELEIDIGLEEGLRLLKASLTSTSALTDGLIDPILKKQRKRKR